MAADVGAITKAAKAIGGNRVRIQDPIAGGSGSSCSRGWHILRSQWREFCYRRPDIPSEVLPDLEAPAPAQRPMSMNLSKDGFDRMVDKIQAHYSSSTPRSVSQAKLWSNASQSNMELRALLGDPWLHRRDDGETITKSAVKDPAMAFFPAEWANCCSEETLAELIVDAYSSDFVDAFLDGAISLVEVSNKWQAVQSDDDEDGVFAGGLRVSKSESSLERPKENRRFRNTDPALLQMGRTQPNSTPSQGFTMNGLSRDPWDAWDSQNFHSCKSLDPFVKRIQKATEEQRPQRRAAKLPEKTRHSDQRKYVWPMAATNFPKAWDRSSRQSRTMVKKSVDTEEQASDKWLLKVGNDGRTTFPYSLVSHRAFIESQSDPVLKDKARKIAPLRLSSHDWSPR